MLGATLGTKLVAGTLEGKSPRLDVFAPMTVSRDANGGSTYVVLFYDRGDSAIERSYVRLGGSQTVTINSLQLLEPDTAIANEEYRVQILFSVAHATKEKSTTGIVIPVVDGLLRPEGTITLQTIS